MPAFWVMSEIRGAMLEQVMERRLDAAPRVAFGVC